MARFGIFDTLEQGLTLAFRNYGAFLRVLWPFVAAGVAVAMLETLIFGAAVMDLRTEGDIIGALGDGRLLDEFSLILPLGSVTGLLSRAIEIVGTGVGIVVAAGLLSGESLDLRSAWQRLLPRLANLVLTGILVSLILLAIVAGGALVALVAVVGPGFASGFAWEALWPIVPVVLALVVFAAWLLLRWAVVEPVSVLETRSVGANLARSADLTRGSKWRVLGLYVVLYICIGIAGGFILVPFGFAFGETPSLAGMFADALLSGVVDLLLAPIFPAIAVVLYRALSARAPPMAAGPADPT